jgi:hypothetical protein
MVEEEGDFLIVVGCCPKTEAKNDKKLLFSTAVSELLDNKQRMAR